MQTILLLLAALCFGALLGFFWAPPRLQKIGGAMQKVLVYAMLFCLGVGYGADPAFFEKLGTLGLRAVVITLLSTGLTVLVSFLLVRLVFRKKEGEQ